MKGISSFNTTELNCEFYLEVFHPWEKKKKSKRMLLMQKSQSLKRYAVPKLRSPM